MTTTERIKKVIIEVTGISEDNIFDYTYFGYDLELNQIKLDELFMRLEHEFKIDIPEAMSRNISVKDMATYIDSALKRKEMKKSKKLTMVNFFAFNLTQRKNKIR